MLKNVAIVMMALLVAACSSNVRMNDSSSGAYLYSGEKYGRVNVALAESVSEDAKKTVRAEQLDLAGHILAQLKARQLYDAASANVVDVKVNSIRVRSAFNAIMFGFMSGSDNLSGTVSLKSARGPTLASFDIEASYSLGGFGGGQNQTRLGWLSEKFAELTVATIADGGQAAAKK